MVRRSNSFTISNSDASAGSGLPSARLRRTPLACRRASGRTSAGTLALELAPEAITVNGISPGPFGTEMNRALMENPEINAEFIASIPLGRWGKVEEIGQLAVYLCSEEAGFITGTDIVIDGGWTAR